MKLSGISVCAVKLLIPLTYARLAVVYRSSADAELGADFGLPHTVHVAVQDGKSQCGDLGDVVTHKKFVDGTITWIGADKKYMHVKFPSGEKQFIFPDAFVLGFLKLKQ